MRAFNLSSLAVATALACLSSQGFAQTCPTTTKTVSLTSTSAAPLTHAAINSAINAATSTVTTVINLSGVFNVGGQINIPSGKNCITLQTPAGTSQATLKWVAPSTVKEFMLYGAGNYGIKLANLILDGRDVTLTAGAGGVANTTVTGVSFINSKTSDISLSGANYVLRLLPTNGLAKGWTITNNKFLLTAGQDAPYGNTAILGYLADTVTMTGNVFKDVDEAIHFQGIRNANISSNTGTGLLRSAIELQEGYAMSPSVAFDNTAITIDKNSFVSWRNSQVDWVLGISIASGSGVTVTNNTLITNSSTLAGCNATPVTATPWEKWGMEFTAVNSSAKTNTFCGFDYGIRVGFLGSRKFTSGTDVTNLDGNTLANMYVSGIEMFHGDTAAYGRYGQKYDDALKAYVETPAAARARWAANFEAIDRQLLVNNNKFINTRMTAFNGGFTWFKESPVLVNGVSQTYSRVPENFTSHVKKLTMTSNVVDRAYGFFPTDITASAIYWNDKRFIGMAIPAIVTATNLGVSSNTVNLTNAPAAGTDFMYRGMEVSPLISGDDGKNYDPSKTLLNSKVWLNTVTAATKQFGSAVYLNDASAAPGNDPWQGLQIQGNTFKNTLVGVDTQSTLVRSSFSGNTCTNVAKPGPGC